MRLAAEWEDAQGKCLAVRSKVEAPECLQWEQDPIIFLQRQVSQEPVMVPCVWCSYRSRLASKCDPHLHVRAGERDHHR